MAIYIEWDEKDWKITDTYALPIAEGGGIKHTYEEITVTKSARYSSDDSEEMQARARDYIASDCPGARVVVVADD